MPPTRLRVRANPFHTIDHLGRPAGLVPKEVTGGPMGALSYVGARLAKTEPADIPGNDPPIKGEMRQLIEVRTWEFSPDAVEVIATPYYLRAVADGDLIADDEATARKAGIDFVPPADALAASRAKAIADWRASYGEDPAFASDPAWVLPVSPAPAAPAAAPKTPKAAAPAATPDATKES